MTGKAYRDRHMSDGTRARFVPAVVAACVPTIFIAVVASASLAVIAVAAQTPPPPPAAVASPFDTFLDRLMLAESGGRLAAKNPRSTAVGPFQFIETTFLATVRRHFATEVAALDPARILALRTDAVFARRAAAAFTQDNADYLASVGLTASFANLRLAHLLGPAGAARILRAPASSQVALWLGPAVITANPFLAAMRVEDLIARCQREVSTNGALAARPGGTVSAKPAKPQIQVACDLSLASCRRWLALAERRVGHGGKK